MSRQIKLSASNVSKLLDQNCMRKMVFDTTTDEELDSRGIKNNREINPAYHNNLVNRLLFREGNIFEQDIYDGIDAVDSELSDNIEVIFAPPKDGKSKFGRLKAEDIIPFIESPPNSSEENKLFYQVGLPISENFIQRYILSVDSSLLKKSTAILDLLYFDTNEQTWYIIDIKKSEVISNSHRYQIAFYWMLFDTWIRYDLGLSASISLTGYVRLRGTESDSILGEPFDLNPFIARVTDALAYLFPESLQLPLDHHQWHLIYSCEKCDYFLHCQQDSKENHYISELPYLTRTAKQFLNDSDIIYLEEAVDKLESDPDFGNNASSIKKEREQIIKRLHTKINYLNDEESYPWEFIRKPVFDMPNPFFLEYPLFISAEKEYIHGYVYQISVLYRDRGDTKLLTTESLQKDPLTSNYYFINFIMEDHTPEEQIRILKEFLIFVNNLLTDISNLDEDLKDMKRNVHFFFPDKVDLKNIYATSLKYSVQDAELQKNVELLLTFFPPTQEYINENEDPERIWNVPYTVLATVIRKTLIMPVESTLWKIQEVWRDHDTKESILKVRRPSRRYLRDISNQFTLLFADDYWKNNKYLTLDTEDGKKNLKTLTEYKTRLCMQLYWKLASLNGIEEASIFILYKAALATPRLFIGASDDHDQLAEDLIQNIPDDEFVRPLNYFQSCENLTESIAYYRNISSDLQERLALGIALSNITIVQTYPPKSKRDKGFYLDLILNSLNTSKIKLNPGKDFYLSDIETADKLYSLKYIEKANLSIEIKKVDIELSTVKLHVKIPGNRQGIIKNPFFQDVIYSGGTVNLSQKHLNTSYVLDVKRVPITALIIRAFLTSFAFFRLSDLLPSYLNVLLPPTSLANFTNISPDAENSFVLQEWEKIPELTELSNFNLKQRTAVNSVLLQNTLNLVWGPPGTGKTRVIAWSILISLFGNIIDNNEQPIRKIAVTAFTNRAIDNALDKFLTALAEFRRIAFDHDIGEIFIVRARGKKLLTIFTSNQIGEDEEDGLRSNETDDFDYYEDLVKDDYSIVIVFGTVFQLNHLSEKEMTLTEAYIRVKEDNRPTHFKSPTEVFDFIVVDEASQLKVTEFFMAAFTIKSTGKFLIVGDDKQLSPVIVGEYPDEFSDRVGSIYSYFKELVTDLIPIMLDQTYRFSNNIANFPSTAYYNGNLFSEKDSQTISLSSDSNESYLDPILNNDKEIVLFTYKGLLRTQDNEVEAEIVAKIVAYYNEFLLHGERSLTNEEFSDFLGVITPHNAQINAINNAIIQEGIPLERIPLIDTVDKYQGQERNIIIISYAVSDADYAEREIEFILSPNRFNVSITRPETKYIVILSEDLINILPEDEEHIKYAFLFQDYKNSFSNRQEFTFNLRNGDFSGTIYF